MNVAIPVWDGRVSPVFDVAGHLLVIGVENGAACARREIYLVEESLPARAKKLSELGVEVLICGAISRGFVDLLKAFRISVIPWVAGELDEVLNAYFAGELPDPRFAMPGH